MATTADTVKTIAESRGRFRSAVPPMWQFLVGAAIFHIVITIGLSPSVFTGKGRSDSPEALFQKAQQFEKDGQYEDAFKAYTSVVSKKPLVAAVYTDAEKKMNEMRMKSIQSKKTAPVGDSGQKSGAPGKNGQKPDGKKQPGAAPDGKTPDKKPPVDLPALPEIGQ